MLGHIEPHQTFLGCPHEAGKGFIAVGDDSFGTEAQHPQGGLLEYDPVIAGTLANDLFHALASRDIHKNPFHAHRFP